MGGRGASFTTAREIVGQYDMTDITDSKSKIVSFFRDIDKDGGIRVDEEAGKIKVTKAAMQKARDLAEELTDRMVERDDDSLRMYRDIPQIMNGEYTISDQDRSNISDFNAYIRSSENFIKIRRHGMSLDSAYQELASMYPYYFDADRVTNPADQLQDINRVLRDLKDSTRPIPREYRQDAADDLRTSIIRGYIALQYRRGRRSA